MSMCVMQDLLNFIIIFPCGTYLPKVSTCSAKASKFHLNQLACTFAVNVNVNQKEETDIMAVKIH